MDLIIGAGITGLSYAMFSKNSEYLILEKENEIGGYCRTTKRNGFVWDFSGHFFHFQDSDIKDLILKGMDKEKRKEGKGSKDLPESPPFVIHQVDYSFFHTP